MLVMSALAVRYGNAFDCPAILFRNEMKTKIITQADSIVIFLLY